LTLTNQSDCAYRFFHVWEKRYVQPEAMISSKMAIIYWIEKSGYVYNKLHTISFENVFHNRTSESYDAPQRVIMNKNCTKHFLWSNLYILTMIILQMHDWERRFQTKLCVVAYSFHSCSWQFSLDFNFVTLLPGDNWACAVPQFCAKMQNNQKTLRQEKYNRARLEASLIDHTHARRTARYYGKL
jgi:hypothetical protein